MKKTMLLSSILLCNMAMAYDDATHEVTEIELSAAKHEVFETAQKYAQAVACDTTFDEDSGELTGLNNIYPVEYSKMFNDSGVHGRFLVLWGGDIGCMGGNGTAGYSLTEFERMSGTRPFTMQKPDLLEELYDISEINTRFIQDVSYNDRTKNLEIISYSFAPKDSNHSPSLKYRYNFKKSDTDIWSLSGKTRLN